MFNQVRIYHFISIKKLINKITAINAVYAVVHFSFINFLILCFLYTKHDGG